MNTIDKILRRDELLARRKQARSDGRSVALANGLFDILHVGHLRYLEAASGAADILQPDVCGCGGITEMRKIVAMAETAGVRVVPHVWGTSVAIAASLHMLATLPPTPPRHDARAPMLEFDQTHNPYRQAIIVTPFVQKDGIVQVPVGPGLGIEMNRETLQRFAVEI